MENCIFCKIVRAEIPSEKVFESSNFIVIKDIHPVSEGHCLIIPKKHCATIFEFSDNLGNELVQIAKAQGERLIKEKFAKIKSSKKVANLSKENFAVNYLKNNYAKFSKEGKADGFNILQSNFRAANQEVDHLHFHIIPRKNGDLLKPFSKIK